MTYDEFLNWHAYFELQPYQWQADERASNIMSAFGAKGADKAFPSLVGMKKAYAKKRDKQMQVSKTGATVVQGSNLFNSPFFSLMSSATGGASIEGFKDGDESNA